MPSLHKGSIDYDSQTYTYMCAPSAGLALWASRGGLSPAVNPGAATSAWE